jgi:hypothetical protein
MNLECDQINVYQQIKLVLPEPYEHFTLYNEYHLGSSYLSLMYIKMKRESASVVHRVLHVVKYF